MLERQFPTLLHKVFHLKPSQPWKMQFRLSTIALLFSSMFFLKSSLLRLLIDFFPVAVIASAGPIPSVDNVELRDVIVSLSFINA